LIQLGLLIFFSNNLFIEIHLSCNITFKTYKTEILLKKTIDELKTEVDKRDASIKQLQTSLKEAETILVYIFFYGV
jgi:competence transcription factor ComK